jgi:hypothetical protein
MFPILRDVALSIVWVGWTDVYCNIDKYRSACRGRWLFLSLLLLNRYIQFQQTTDHVWSTVMSHYISHPESYTWFKFRPLTEGLEACLASKQNCLTAIETSIIIRLYRPKYSYTDDLIEEFFRKINCSPITKLCTRINILSLSSVSFCERDRTLHKNIAGPWYCLFILSSYNAVPQHTYGGERGRGGIAPTLSQPRH